VRYREAPLLILSIRNMTKNAHANCGMRDTVESSDIFLRGVQSYHGKWKHPHIRKRPDASTIRVYEYDHEITAVANSELSAVQILIGSPEKSSRWISLSENCWAQIAENRLKGFLVEISD